MNQSFPTYEAKKAKLLANFNDLIQAKEETISLKKNTSNLFRHRKNTNNKKMDVRSFNKVLQVDPKNLEAVVEGMTTFEELTRECLKFSCLPAVVPELKTITIGGALSGVAIESSSFRYGLVHESILEFEVLLGNGQVVVCRPNNEHRDLFYAFPNSYGTLGYALKVKIKLIPAKKFVRLKHHLFHDAKSYFAELERLCLLNQTSGNIDYIDGVVFDQNHMYITTGEFVDEAPYTSHYQYMKIYYRSIHSRTEDYLTAEDYIWRWDTDWFWCSKFFFMQHFIPRLLFGKFLLNSARFWKLRRFFNKGLPQKIISLFQRNTEAVIQDVEIPIQNAAEFLGFFQENIGIKPVWICPIIPTDDAKFNFYPMQPRTLYINFGFWDVVPSNQTPGYYNRLIEKKVNALNGKKSLYSNVYYSEDEFWKIYDKTLYQQLKLKYDPNTRFGFLYKKAVEKA